MEFEIINVFLSFESRWDEAFDPDSGYTDVIIQTKKGKKYVASFFSYKSIALLKKRHQEKAEFLFGEYFWAQGMVLIERCSRENIEKVIHDMNEEGSMHQVFRLI